MGNKRVDFDSRSKLYGYARGEAGLESQSRGYNPVRGSEPASRSRVVSRAYRSGRGSPLPSLELDFTTGQIHPLRPAGLLTTFSRAGATATRVNSQGLVETVAADVPRFDYNPVTKALRGLLIEEARTNLYLRSGDIGTSPWNILNAPTVTQQFDIAPDGTLSATKVEDTSGAAHAAVTMTASIPADTAIRCLSIHVKKDNNTVRFPLLHLIEGTNRYRLKINTKTGEVANYTGTVASGFGSFDAGDYWRVWIAGANDGVGTAMQCEFYPAASTTWGPGEEDTTGSAICWGAQAEPGSFPSSYIPTVDSQQTRNADVCRLASLVPWFNALEGTIEVEMMYGQNYGGINNRIFDINDGTLNNRISVFTAGTKIGMGVRALAAWSALASNGPAATVGEVTKLALSYKLKYFPSANDGFLLANSQDNNLGLIPVVTRAEIGNWAAGTQQLGLGWLRRIRYYRQRLGPTELKYLSTPFPR